MRYAKVTDQIEEMTIAECLAFLAGNHIGRIAVNVDEFPVVLPVNYQLAEHSASGPVLVVRTREGGTVSGAGERVAFQIDAIDAACGVGWSVLVRGIMHHVRGDVLEAMLPSVDPHPWLAGRDDWLVINPIAITGRRVLSREVGFGFHPLGYL